MDTYSEKVRRQRAWQQRVLADGFTHFVTFVFNTDNMSIENAKKKIYAFRARIDRKLYGKNYTKQKRTSLLAFPEHLNSNLHYHATLSTDKAQEFNGIANEIWKKLVPAGNLDIKYKDFSEEDKKGIISYIVADYTKTDYEEHYIALGEK